MEFILNWGILTIKWVQSFRSDFLDVYFKFFSFLGGGLSYIILIALIWWLFRQSLGLRLLNVLIFSSILNIILKNYFQLPRPFLVNDQIAQLSNPGGYSLPSGHAQAAVVFWITLAFFFNKKWAWIASAYLILSIGLSRIYLAVHYPSDILAGYLIGACFLFLFHLLGPKLNKKWGELDFKFQSAFLLLTPFLVGFFYTDKGVISQLCVVFGALFGSLAFQKYSPEINYLNIKNTKNIVIVLFLGICPLFLFYIGFKWFYRFENLKSLVLIFQYLLMGFWISFGAPLIFSKSSK